MDTFKTERQKVGVFTPIFMGISMTFIYRQLLGVCNDYRPIVLTNKVENLKAFPFPDVHLKQKSLLDRIVSNFFYFFTNNFKPIPPSHIPYWEKIIKEHNLRLIHAHFGPSGLLMLPIAKKLNIPLLVSFHGYDASRLLANKKYVKSLRRLFEYSYIISVSKIMTDRLVAIGANPSKIKLLYYSIPKDAFTYTARTPLLEKMKSGAKIHFLQVSNFVEKKGHRYTVEAFCRFLKKYSRGRLILAGDGPERPKIEALCKELNIAGKVSFLGRVVESQVIELMKSVDVFLHHSVIDSQGEEEGIPNVIMEAMATGLPIVSTFHAGIPELVRNEVDGLLVRERDVDQYAQKLIEVVESDKRYGENGAARIRSHFNVDVQNEVLADHYREIIEG